jgi:hypothetical protein
MALFDWLAQDIAGNPDRRYASPGVPATYGSDPGGIGAFKMTPEVPPVQASLGKGSAGITYGDIMKSLMGSSRGKPSSGFLPQSPELGRAGGNVDPSAMQQGQGVFQQLNQPRQQGGGSGNMLMGLLERYFTGMGAK